MDEEQALKFFEKVGGSAFPGEWTFPTGEALSCPGMTLRDAIAIAVLPAIIEADGIQFASNVTAHAIWAYEQADAMLKAREVTP